MTSTFKIVDEPIPAHFGRKDSRREIVAAFASLRNGQHIRVDTNNGLDARLERASIAGALHEAFGKGSYRTSIVDGVVIITKSPAPAA